MARDFAKGFYKSRAWIDTREAYAKSVGGLCELCLKRGIYTPGTVVHHKVHLTPENINDPEISLSWNNLMLVCQDCHAKIHAGKAERRYKVDELGRVIA